MSERFQVGDRVLTPSGAGTIERFSRPGEAVVRGDNWIFYGSFLLEDLTPLVGAIAEAA